MVHCMNNISKIIIFSLLYISRAYASYGDSGSILGTWGNADLDAPVSYSEKTYFKDGTSCGFILESPYAGESGGLYIFKGKWRIENGILISSVVESSSSFLIKGKEIKDKIVSINENFLTLRSFESSQTYTRFRIPEDRGSALCNISLKK